MTDKPSLSLAGQTLRFRFDDGPTAGTTYEHKFNSDGTVVYRGVGDGAKAKSATEEKQKSGEQAPKQSGSGGESGPKAGPTKYASYEVAPRMHLVSYLSGQGYTLTVLVNTNDGNLHGFASSSKEWYPVTGKLQPTG